MIVQRLIKKLLNRNKMTEVKQDETYYVWIKTERLGDIVQVDTSKSEANWINFTDGTRINPSLIKEMLLPASTLEQAQSISKDFGGIGNTTSPKPEVIAAPKAVPVQVVEENQPAEINVMMEMLRKMSKKNIAEMTVGVNIPSAKVYELLQDQMDLDAEDLNEQIGLLVESQINNMKENLKEQITNFITNYYK
jgi:hypothetical protein